MLKPFLYVSCFDFYKNMRHFALTYQRLKRNFHLEKRHLPEFGAYQLNEVQPKSYFDVQHSHHPTHRTIQKQSTSTSFTVSRLYGPSNKVTQQPRLHSFSSSLTFLKLFEQNEVPLFSNGNAKRFITSFPHNPNVRNAFQSDTEMTDFDPLKPSTSETQPAQPNTPTQDSPHPFIHSTDITSNAPPSSTTSGLNMIKDGNFSSLPSYGSPQQTIGGMSSPFPATDFTNPFLSTNPFAPIEQMNSALGSESAQKTKTQRNESSSSSEVSQSFLRGSTTSNAETTTSEARYNCTQCAKSFRLETALITHMGFKHGIVLEPGAVQPTSSTTAIKISEASGPDTRSDVKGSISTNNDNVSPSRGSESDVQQNASKRVLTVAEEEEKAKLAGLKKTAAENLPPEEVTIAAHGACVNTAVLVGKVCDISTGFVYEQRVFQFTVMCPFNSPPAGESDRDAIIVRFFLNTEPPETLKDGLDESAAAMEKILKEQVTEGATVCVVGQVRMNPQMESINSKYYYYPLVQVTSSCGSVMSF